MPDKVLRMQLAQHHSPRRPVMLAIAGDSAAGKTTLTRGLIDALGPERSTSMCVDDYHRYDREERKTLPFTALHPDGNYLEIIEQHLQLLASGRPVLKPVYDHATGELVRPQLVEPRDVVIVEGLFPLHSTLARACFDLAVYLDPPEEIRREWKVRRDTSRRGYRADQVIAELERREPESERYVRPQRAEADIVVRFAPVPSRDDPPGVPLSVELILRGTGRHADLERLFTGVSQNAMHLKLIRDAGGRPVDALHVHGYAPREDNLVLEKAIWAELGSTEPLPTRLGRLDDADRSEPLAITQLLLLYHLLSEENHPAGPV